ncbi:MAG: amidohydrolase [Tissierellaceae bacterium]|nr:amidohydrolase [Tissierellaceae bacterium]
MDSVFINGKIYTMDKDNTKAEAMYIRNGRFLKIGSNDEISCYANDNAKVIDLQHKPIYPGFIDSHMHLAMFGSNLYECNLVGTKSIEELINKVKDYISSKKIPKGDWVIGKGWNEDYFNVKRLPNRYDLDKISKEHNICLTRGCYHMCVVNSNVLDEIGINKENHEINNGIFDIDQNSVPTGICRESAMKLVYSKLPKVSKDRFKEYIKLASNYVLSRGITSLCTDDFMLPGIEWQNVIDSYTEMNRDGELKIRVYEQCLLPTLEYIKEFASKGYKTGIGDDHFKIGQLKILTDGNLGTRTAYLSEPYSDDNSTFGIPQYTQNELDNLILTATESGLQIASHAIGDKSINMVIDALEKLPEEYKKRDLRSNIVHCQVTNDRLLKKFKKLNIVANVQPIFLNYDIHMAESRLGPSRITNSYNWKTLLNEGIKVALGSDSPVELPDTMLGIYSAVTRKDLNGFPNGGWFPEEKLTVDEALHGFTIDAAYSSFSEDIKGSIEIGKLADFVVLSENIYEIEPENIKNVKVLKTFIDGKLVFDIEKI